MQNAIQTFPSAAVNAGAAVAADALSAPLPPDFDFQMPCRYFKSSFARSLSLNNSNNTALALAKNSPQIEAKQPQQQQQHQLAQEKEREREKEKEESQLQSPCSTPPPALPARRHTTNNNNLTHLNTAPANQQQQQQQQQRNLSLAVAWSMQVRNLCAFIEFYRLLFLLLLPLPLRLLHMSSFVVVFFLRLGSFSFLFGATGYLCHLVVSPWLPSLRRR